MTSIGALPCSPRRITEPLPHCRSICVSAVASAFSRSARRAFRTRVHQPCDCHLTHLVSGPLSQPPEGFPLSPEKVSGHVGQFSSPPGICGQLGRPAHLQDTKLSRTPVRIATDTPKLPPAAILNRRLPTLAAWQTVQDVPDSAVILALSRVEFGIDSVLDALRTQDPFGIRSILTEYSAQEQPNLAEKGLILAIDRLLKMKVPGHAEWPTLPLAKRCDWWVERLGGFAAVVAGLPRISGAAADRPAAQGHPRRVRPGHGHRCSLP